MKQHITKQQLISADRDYIRNKIGWEEHTDITIGAMIKFLGRDFFRSSGWAITEIDRLCDDLWTAVKEKLKSTEGLRVGETYYMSKEKLKA